MNIQNHANKKLFVLDTNVLIHDPTCLFRFQEHNILIPMVVLEELDKHKKGMSDESRNARQASRFMDEIISNANNDSINDGLLLSDISHNPNKDASSDGRLFFQTKDIDVELDQTLPGQIADNTILKVTAGLCKLHPELEIILVTKDINMRIKAATLDIVAEDYQNDQVLEDIDLLPSGWLELPDSFWDTHKIESWQDGSVTKYSIEGDMVAEFYPNLFVYNDRDSFDAVVLGVEGGKAILKVVVDYTKKATWGVKAKNREQNFALNALMDPDIDFVTLLGNAGTGKTLLALAAGLTQVLDAQRYSEIIMTRETVPLGKEIGYLPGSEEEKLAPWMGAITDNLEFLGASGKNKTEVAINKELLMNKIKIRSLGFMRGRTFLNRYLILDEAQNLTAKQMKALITRAGPGTKVVCIGNLGQIDTPYLTATTSGLTYVVDKFRGWQHGGHIALQICERSRLSDFASEVL